MNQLDGGGLVIWIDQPPTDVSEMGFGETNTPRHRGRRRGVRGVGWCPWAPTAGSRATAIARHGGGAIGKVGVPRTEELAAAPLPGYSRLLTIWLGISVFGLLHVLRLHHSQRRYFPICPTKCPTKVQ